MDRHVALSAYAVVATLWCCSVPVAQGQPPQPPGLDKLHRVELDEILTYCGLQGGGRVRHHNGADERPLEVESRIYDGKTAAVGHFPAAVSLRAVNPGRDLVHTCGGTLVTWRHVVTAAHCFTDPGFNSALNWTLEVRVGGVCNRPANECRTKWMRPNEEVMTVVPWERVYWQTDYDMWRFRRNNDLAIVQLRGSVRHLASTNRTHFACLFPPIPAEVAFKTRPVLATGWGFYSRNNGQFLGPEQPSWAAYMATSPLLRYAMFTADRRLSEPPPGGAVYRGMSLGICTVPRIVIVATLETDFAFRVH